MSSQLPTIAFFGATGGCANSALVNALRGGAKVVALARTPSKLMNLLKKQGVSEPVLSSQLTIISGNAKDVANVKSTLTANNPNHIVSHIVSGLGGSPSMRMPSWKLLDFVKIDDENICGTSAAVLVSALKELYTATPALAQRKPKITFVSTTGVTDGPDDVPCLMRSLYHNILAVPHQDKRVMERIFREGYENRNDQVFSGLVGCRCTLLTGDIDADSGSGIEKIKVGTEANPALGYTVSRADVGKWIWVNAVSNEQKRQAYEGHFLTLTF